MAVWCGMGVGDRPAGPAWLRHPVVWMVQASAAAIWIALGVAGLVTGRRVGLVYLVLGVGFAVNAVLTRRSARAGAEPDGPGPTG